MSFFPTGIGKDDDDLFVPITTAPLYAKKVDIYLREHTGEFVAWICKDADEITANKKWEELKNKPAPPFMAYQWKERYEKI